MSLIRRLLFLLFCLAAMTRAQGVSWEPTNGPHGGPVNACVVDRQGVIYLGHGNGISLSTNNGTSWTLNSGFHGSVAALALDSSGSVLANSSDSLYSSTDQGGTWRRIPVPSGTSIRCLQIASDNRITLATSKGILWSTDQGGTWTTRGGADTTYYSLTSNASGTWIAGSAKGIRRSTDGGLNWATTNTSVVARSLFRSSSGALIAGSSNFENVCYRSTDDGISWTSCGLRGGYTITTFVELSPGVLLFGTNTDPEPSDYGVYRSTNDGTNWGHLGLQNTPTNFITRLPERSLIAGTSIGLYRSTDEGLSWTIVDVGVQNTNIMGIIVPYPLTIFAASIQGVFQSTDGGLVWKNLCPDFNPPLPLAITSDADGRLFFSTMLFGSGSVGGIYRSIDSGATWTNISKTFISGSFDYIKSLVCSPHGSVFAGVSSKAIYRSSDHGDTWQKLSYNFSGINVKSMAIDSAGHIFVASWGQGLYRSTDDGMTWATANNGMGSINLNAIAVKGTRWIFAGGADGIYRSSDDGEVWLKTTSGLSMTVTSIVIGPGGEIIASSSSPGLAVYKSEDDGTTWFSTGRGLPSASINALAASTDGTIYAGTAGFGVFAHKNLSGPPKALGATEVGAIAFVANWSAVPTASYFVLDVGLDSNFTSYADGYRSRSVGNVTRFAVRNDISMYYRGLAPATQYFYRVRVVSAEGEISGNSNTVAVTTQDTTTIDIFPLSKDMRRSYSYRFANGYSDNISSSSEIDSGTVEYVVLDSTQLGDSTLLWTIQQTENLLHHVWGHTHDSSYDTTYSKDTSVTVTLSEDLHGFHEINCNSLVWSLGHWASGDHVYRRWFNPTRSVYQTNYIWAIEQLYFEQTRGLYKRDFSNGSHGNNSWSTSTIAVLLDPQTGMLSEELSVTASGFRLFQNYPNPFNPSSDIGFQISEVSTVRLAVYDILGREVAVLTNEKKAPGTYQVHFDASGLASGVYIYRLTAGKHVEARKMILVR